MQTTEHASEYWTLNKASKELGINKSTLSMDASKGKIQWHPQPDGSKKLFVPELLTFYAERLKRRTERAERVLNGGKSPEIEHQENSENNGLNTAIEAKNEVVDLLKAQLEDVRRDRDEWRRQAESAAHQLTEALTVIKSLPAPKSEPVPEQRRKKFLGLF